MSNNRKYNNQFINSNEPLFEAAFNSMNPDYFSSFEFGKKLHSLGVNKRVTANGSVIRDYLQTVAIRITNRTWRKKISKTQLTIEDAINKQSAGVEIENTVSEDNLDVKIQNAINLLKSNGYRVFKETKHIEEI
jgi:hypothetical protein